MKKNIFKTLCILFISSSIFAQIKVPKTSPRCKTEQVIGLTTFHLDYSRPSVKGRTIFGDLVPFNERWRTGANSNTTIAFSSDIKFAGKIIPKGTYALYTIPNQDSWEIILYKIIDNWGLPKKWNPKDVIAETTVSAKKGTHQESLSINFDDISYAGVNLIIRWADTNVSIPIGINTDDIVKQSFKKAMDLDNVSADDYYKIASYSLDSGKNINDAKQYIDKAVKLKNNNTPYWMLIKKAQIYAKAGNKAEAIKIGNQSIKAAEKAGATQYVRYLKKIVAKF